MYLKFTENNGMTLLEVIVGINLLIIILLPIYSFYLQTISLLEYLEKKEEALLLARRKMEYLKVCSFSQLQPEVQEEEVYYNNRKYLRQIIIKDLDPEIKEIEIIILAEKRLISLKNRIIGSNDE